MTTEGALFYVDLDTRSTEGWELGIDIAPLAGVSPDGRYIIYGQHQYLLDTATSAVCQIEGVSGWAGAFSPDGRYFLAETAAGVAKLRSDACGREREMLGLPLPGQGWAGNVWRHPSVAWSPDGKALVVWVYSDPTHEEPHGKQYVYLVSPELEAPATVQLGDDARSSLPVAWSPEGSGFALASGTSLAVVDRRGQLLWSTDIPGSWLANVTWSPDGASLSVHTPGWVEEIDGELRQGAPPAVYTLHSGTGAILFRLWGASACWGEVWTADGRALIAVGQRADDFGWFVVTADGASVRRLDEADTAFFVEPSPTDRDVAAFLGRPTYPGGEVGSVEGPLMAVDLDTGQAAPVVDISLESRSPGWDPAHPSPRWLSDGRLVFFTGTEGHGGCEMGPKRPELEVQFPPFPPSE